MTTTTTKTRPINVIDRLSSSFKNFESKLDKLQNDLNYHGQTLSDLRVMVLNLASGTIVPPDVVKQGPGETKKKRTMAIQYDIKLQSALEAKFERRNSANEETGKIVRKNVDKNSPAKLKTKSLHSQKRLVSPFQSQLRKLETSQLHVQRHRKAEANRKAINLRTAESRQKKLTLKKMAKVSK